MDAYDEMVAYLTEHPAEIGDAWGNTIGHRCGALFSFAVPNRLGTLFRSDGGQCGCLTMIRFDSSYRVAWTDALTLAIAGDERIPKRVCEITVDTLPIFAGWQRRIDAILNRTPPVWNGPPCAKPEVEMEAVPSVEVEVVSE